MSKFHILAIAAFAVFMTLAVQAATTNGSILLNPAFGSHGYITRAMGDLLSLTRDSITGALKLNSLQLTPETASFTLIGIALVGFSILTRKPKRG